MSTDEDTKTRWVQVVQVPEDRGIGLVDSLRAVYAGKWIVIGITLLFAVASITYSLLSTPIFRAEAILAPTASDRPSGNLADLGGLASLAGIRVGSGGDSVRAIAVLRSRGFVEEYIRDNDLLPVLFSEEWDEKNARWSVDDEGERPDIRDGVRKFVEQVRYVSEDRETGLVTLAIEWHDPEVAARWAGDLVSRINARLRQQDIHELEQKLEYLNEQLAAATLVELRQAISRVIEEQINAMMLARSQTEYAFKVIDPPVVPKERVSPARTLIVLVGIFAGGLIGLVAALARSAFRGRGYQS